MTIQGKPACALVHSVRRKTWILLGLPHLEACGMIAPNTEFNDNKESNAP
jgi:hypothetical protein